MNGLTAAFWIAATVLISIAGVGIIRRLIPFRETHNSVAGAIYSVLGVLYAVLLAFVVFAVWEEYDRAQANVSLEAALISDLYRDAHIMPEPTASQLRSALETYTRLVHETEWPQLGAGDASNEARQALRSVWQAMAAAQPVSTTQQAWYSAMIERLNDLAEVRQERLHASRTHLPTAMWVVLIFGAIVTIGFSYIFGLEPAWLHIAMVGMLSATLALILVLIAALDHPFVGITRITPDAFEQLAPVFQVWRQ